MTPFDISSATVELPELASHSPSPSPTVPSTPTDSKGHLTTFFVAVAIIACVLGFEVIVNLLTRKSNNRISSHEA
jgi:hypothetical protein